MPVDHAGFLELAKESLDSKNREIDYRNAVSKSYYFMYHSALTITNGKIGKTGSDGKAFSGGMHKKFSSYLLDNAAFNHGLDKKQTEKIGLLLKQSHALRISADYHLDQTVYKATAEMMVRRAADFEGDVLSLIK